VAGPAISWEVRSNLLDPYQAEAEREKRAKIISAQGESLAAAALGDASDIMMAHPLALQLRNLQSLVEIGVDKNTTVVFPAPLMTTIAELGAFLAHEQATATPPRPVPGQPGHRRQRRRPRAQLNHTQWQAPERSRPTGVLSGRRWHGPSWEPWKRPRTIPSRRNSSATS
jgi:hypothetical protein